MQKNFKKYTETDLYHYTKIKLSIALFKTKR